ncbi:MAG TPA: tyrosine-type recombinase/integrase [Candidatus Binatia bacterium]|nr:tyrosine-type recombinase/integrase [Candidatus Binatia bacterium]
MKRAESDEKDPILRTRFGSVRVYVRKHLPPCKLTESSDLVCSCPKWIYGNPADGDPFQRAAKTPSLAEAKRVALDILDSFDPDQRELAQMRAEKTKKNVVPLIDDVLVEYYEELVSLDRAKGYIDVVKSLFGTRDAKTGRITGNLYRFLDRENQAKPLAERIERIDQLTPALLKKWRASWTYNDLTRAQRWGMIRNFFRFVQEHGLLPTNPAFAIRTTDVEKGNRCGYFTEEQYRKILEACDLYAPDNVPLETKRALPARMRAIIELMRWGGLAIVDATLFRQDWIDDEDVLRYKRQKSKKHAVVQLPERIVKLLRSVPLEHGIMSEEQPFLFAHEDLESSTANWRRRILAICELGGITEIRTEVGTRAPHPHMFRDTFAIWHLTHGTRLEHVSKMLGHATTTITERHYLPWIRERETLILADARNTLKKHDAPRRTRSTRTQRLPARVDRAASLRLVQ